jgi:hypothetical protein
LVKKRDILLSFIFEGLVLGVQLLFDHFQRVTYYFSILYLVPFLKIGDAGALRYELFALIYIVNALKWILLVWIFRKGHRVLSLLIALLLMALAVLSFPFSELGL